MPNIIFLTIALAAAVTAQTDPPKMSRPTRSTRTIEPRPNMSPCSTEYCAGKSDGLYPLTEEYTNEYLQTMEYEGKYYLSYFLSCSNGIAHCMACAYAEEATYFVECPDERPFLLPSEKYEHWGRCEYNYDIVNGNKCNTSAVVHATNPPKFCPLGKSAADSMCQRKGPDYLTYNLYIDEYPSKYIACTYGTYVDCMDCPAGLSFMEGYDWQGYPSVYGHCYDPSNKCHFNHPEYPEYKEQGKCY